MIRPLPKKITELGKIKIGDQEPNSSGKGTHPHKLETFRLTSPNKPLLHFAANLYGGDPRPWTGPRAPEGQFELYTTVNALDVLVPTASAVNVQYETWSGSGCTLRCTGEVVTHCPLNDALVGQPCQCPEDDKERAEAAKDGKACARICRLNVLLPDLPGMGTWRLETKGYYATAELLGSLEMLEMAQHQIIEASLRLEQRAIKRFIMGADGKMKTQSTTIKYAVPVLWPKYTPRQMLAAADQRVLLMAPPSSPLQIGDSARQAAAELFGDDRQAVVDAHYHAAHFAPQMSVEAQTPIPLPHDTPPEEKAVKTDTVQDSPSFGTKADLIAHINTAWTEFGFTPAQFSSFWEKTCGKFGASAKEELSAFQLSTILKDTNAWIAKQPRKSSPVPMPEVDPTQTHWRAELLPLLGTFRASDPLLKEMFAAADNTETPDDVGRAVLARAREAMAEQAAGDTA